MTTVLDAAPKTPDPATTDTATIDPPGSWRARAGAFALDVLLGGSVITTLALIAVTAPRGGWLWWVLTGTAVLTAVVMAANRLLLPTLTGWSLGRALFGLRVVPQSGGTVGVGRLLMRDVAHLVDTAALFIGWLWPLWDQRNRTFADLVLRTDVRVVDSAEAPRRNVRRIATCVLVIAALLCAAGSGLGYLQVYRQDRAVEQARSQIAEQGPRIVEQLLSYGPKTVVDDFARSQMLATDEYRPLLIAQQQAVRTSGITDNQYWAVSSAVLSATTDRAAMLVALQGQRGSDPAKLRFITATVRADFEKSGDHWQVAVLTVLKKPQTNQQTSEPGQ